MIAALSLTAMMGMLGLGLDVGVLRGEQRQLQSVADAAALGGAGELMYNDVSTGAANAAALDNFVSGKNNDTLTVNNPPLSGPHTGNASYVEVIATQAASTYFMKAFSVDSITLTARAVAYLGNGPACLYALDPSSAGAVTLNGSFQLTLQCTMYVNSNSPQALLANGSGSLTASSIGIVGGDSDNGATLSPTPKDGMVPISDPLGYLAAPSTTGSCVSTTNFNGSGTFTLNPGLYCSQLKINGSPTITFNPGVYVLDNGMTINGSPTMTGTGITFYNVSGSMSLNGSSTSSLKAPTSGDYEGVLIFQARNNSSGMTLNGSADAIVEGAVYAPAARITDNGSGSVGGYMILVADDLTVNGSGKYNDDYSTLSTGSPIKAAVLVE